MLAVPNCGVFLLLAWRCLAWLLYCDRSLRVAFVFGGDWKMKEVKKRGCKMKTYFLGFCLSAKAIAQ
jgi:hypothetical protein